MSLDVPVSTQVHGCGRYGLDPRTCRRGGRYVIIAEEAAFRGTPEAGILAPCGNRS